MNKESYVKEDNLFALKIYMILIKLIILKKSSYLKFYDNFSSQVQANTVIYKDIHITMISIN